MSKLGILLFLLLNIVACSNGGGSSGGSSETKKTTNNQEKTCSEAQIVAGLCIASLALTSNKPLLECIKTYAADKSRKWLLVEEVDSLVCSNTEYQVQSLDGVELFANIKTLTISGLEGNRGPLTNIQKLSDLANLVDARFDYNNISELPKLSGLSQFRSLSLAANSIEDIHSLAEWKALKSVNLQTNPLIHDCKSLDALEVKSVEVARPYQCQPANSVELKDTWLQACAQDTIADLAQVAYIKDYQLSKSIPP